MPDVPRYGVEAQAPLDRIEAAIREAASARCIGTTTCCGCGDQSVSRRRHAHRQRVHARAVGREQDLLDRRSGVSRRPVHRSRGADQIAKLALANGLQFTAHSQGDAAVEALVDAYERINRDDFQSATAVRASRTGAS